MISTVNKDNGADAFFGINRFLTGCGGAKNNAIK
jgi:hypothetical protein